MKKIILMALMLAGALAGCATPHSGVWSLEDPAGYTKTYESKTPDIYGGVERFKQYMALKVEMARWNFLDGIHAANGGYNREFTFDQTSVGRSTTAANYAVSRSLPRSELAAYIGGQALIDQYNAMWQTVGRNPLVPYDGHQLASEAPAARMALENYNESLNVTIGHQDGLVIVDTVEKATDPTFHELETLYNRGLSISQWQINMPRIMTPQERFRSRYLINPRTGIVIGVTHDVGFSGKAVGWFAGKFTLPETGGEDSLAAWIKGIKKREPKINMVLGIEQKKDFCSYDPYSGLDNAYFRMTPDDKKTFREKMEEAALAISMLRSLPPSFVDQVKGEKPRQDMRVITW